MRKLFIAVCETHFADPPSADEGNAKSSSNVTVDRRFKGSYALSTQSRSLLIHHSRRRRANLSALCALRNRSMDHDIEWNGATQTWLCVRCLRTSDHQLKTGAEIELSQFECVKPGPVIVRKPERTRSS
jgi:hypothetical protein